MKHRLRKEIVQPAWRKMTSVNARFLRLIDVNAGVGVSG